MFDENISVTEIKKRIKGLKEKILVTEDLIHKKITDDMKEYEVETDTIKRRVRRHSIKDLKEHLRDLKNELYLYQNLLKQKTGETIQTGTIINVFPK